MIRCWPTALALFVGLCMGVAVESHGTVGSTQAQDSHTTQNSEVAALKVEIQGIKDRLPDQAHAMQDVGAQFANLWVAEQHQHWDLANFFWGETRSHLRWAVRIIPKRKDNAGHEVDLAAILQATENGPLTQLQAAIKSKNKKRFVAAYKFTLEACYACHKASDKPYLRPQIPTEPVVRIINFDPSANWPL
jgi:hypothetical protein